MGLKLMRGLKINVADIYCIIPQFLVYKGLKSTNSVRIRFNKAEESKYEIINPFEIKVVCVYTQLND